MDGNQKKQTADKAVQNDKCRFYIDMLCKRYSERGAVSHVSADAVRQELNESITKRMLPGAYEEGGREKYRSGTYNGAAYMTAEDFVAYYKDGREGRLSAGMTYVPDNVNNQQTEKEGTPSKKAQWLTETERRALPAILRRTAEKYKSGKLNDLAVNWFPLDREVAGEKKRVKIPVGVLASFVIFVVSMTLIISSNVMVSRITTEISRLRSEGSDLGEQYAQLSSQYEVKNNMLMLREKALEYGMVDAEYVSSEYIDMSKEDMITSFSNGDGDGASPILSAVGSR